MSAPTVATDPAAGDRTAGPPAAGWPAGLRALRRGTTWTSFLGIIALLIGLFGPWVQPALSQSMGAFQLPIALRGTTDDAISWGLPLAVACVLAVAGLTAWGRRRPAVPEMAAVLALLSTVGFFGLSVLANNSLQERLRRDETDLAGLQRLVGYTIPRPHLTTLGPIPLPGTAADVLSALRWGFYVSLVGAILMTVAACTARSRVVRPTRRSSHAVRLFTLAVLIAFVVPVARSSYDGWQVRQAESESAVGDDQSALEHYQNALDNGDTVQSTVDLLAGYGLTQLRLGAADGPAARLASSRLQLQSGKDLAALQIIAAAADRWSSSTALHDEFTAQAVDFLRGHSAPQTVRALVTSTNESAFLRTALARYELAAGENPAAISDARTADSLADDDDVRSAALTFLSAAQSRSGDLIGGRKTLLAAVAADHNYVNVMARSLLTGLYTTLPL